ncbi:MAG: GntR family transcriptional regulator [Deltaproteobacteria bacterium]|nr:GntR family transcriptional regulator [Deltaproteobacteria bacterium]
MLDFDSLPSPPSLKDMALQALKKAILEDKLQPERIYRIEELAKALGISKTPVREALHDLSSLGFVTILPRRGIQINALDDKDIRDLYEFRTAMETAVMRRIAPIVTDRDIERAQAINDGAMVFSGPQERMAYLKKDREFHLFLSELSENDYLINALEHVRDLMDWMGIKALFKEERIMEAHEEHRKILDMLRKRDPGGAAAMMAAHIRITEENVLSRLREQQR